MSLKFGDCKIGLQEHIGANMVGDVDFIIYLGFVWIVVKDKICSSEYILH